MVAEVVSLGGQRMSVVFHLLAHQGKVIISEELHNFAALNSELDLMTWVMPFKLLLICLNQTYSL